MFQIKLMSNNPVILNENIPILIYDIYFLEFKHLTFILFLNKSIFQWPKGKKNLIFEK